MQLSRTIEIIINYARTLAGSWLDLQGRVTSCWVVMVLAGTPLLAAEMMKRSEWIPMLEGLRTTLRLIGKQCTRNLTKAYVEYYLRMMDDQQNYMNN